MTSKQKQLVVANKLAMITGTIKRLSKHIDNLLAMQEKNYLETRDNTLLKLLDLQAILQRQYRELVIESLNFDIMEV